MTRIIYRLKSLVKSVSEILPPSILHTLHVHAYIDTHTHTEAAAVTSRVPLAHFPSQPLSWANINYPRRVTVKWAEAPWRTAGSLPLNAWMIGEEHRSLENLACGLHGARRDEEEVSQGPLLSTRRKEVTKVC